MMNEPVRILPFLHFEVININVLKTRQAFITQQDNGPIRSESHYRRDYLSWIPCSRLEGQYLEFLTSNNLITYLHYMIASHPCFSDDDSIYFILFPFIFSDFALF